jgi:hypothetical protein
MQMTITVDIPDYYDDWADIAVQQELEDLYIKNPHINSIMDQMKAITEKHPAMVEVYQNHESIIRSGKIKICEVT